MDKQNIFKCNFCEKEFTSKSNLTNHQKTAKYCLEKQGKEADLVCSYCKKICSSNRRLNEHLESCKTYIEHIKAEHKEYKELIREKDNEICSIRDKEKEYKQLIIGKDDEICSIREKEKEYKKLIIGKDDEICSIRDKEKEYKKLIREKDNEICSIRESLQLTRDMLEKANNTIAEIAKQPKNNTINNNIKTQNNQNNTNNIQNILTDYKTYEEYTNKDRIFSIARENNIEKYFWEGQRGIAEFVNDHIAKTDNGKMIICCTDPTRNRFKYKNESNGISEDIDAHMFTKKISEPIKKIYSDVHNNIQKDIQHQLKSGSKDYTKSELECKKDIALEKNTEIQMISNYKENGEYRKAILTHLKV